MAVLQTKGLTKQFCELTAVEEVDFQIERGEIVGIIGPNGAGKTTFVNLLTGALNATVGNIIFGGEPLNDAPVHNRANRGLVRSFQIPQVCDDLTFLENVRSAILSREQRNSSLFSLLLWEDESRSEAIELVNKFGLGERQNLSAEAFPMATKNP